MNTHARVAVVTNTSTRISHLCDHMCHGSMFYDITIRHGRHIALFGVSVTWYASAYNEEWGSRTNLTKKGDTNEPANILPNIPEKINKIT